MYICVYIRSIAFHASSNSRMNECGLPNTHQQNSERKDLQVKSERQKREREREIDREELKEKREELEEKREELKEKKEIAGEERGGERIFY